MRTTMLSALIVALVSGLAIGSQSTLTNWSGRFIGPLRTGLLVNFSGGLLAALLLLLLALRRQGTPVAALTPGTGLVVLAAGALGIGIIAGIAYALPQVGIAAGLAALISGQMFLAVLVDSLGWGGMGVIPLQPVRLLGLALLLAGTWLILPRAT